MLHSALSAVLLFYNLSVGVVEPHCWNGYWVMALFLKKTTFPLPSVAVLPSKKQKVMNLPPLIQEYVSL
ncbi:uncharacterized protein MONOS_7685 [Monocercomonoides exilis]|uniref:uncharacterized protein n=1 Tax=Monocercomonoides exilis TaxID=2049356 RepID=UPI00355953A7|nr:hypothetical protein MONOS_7685 [Monocercomonoides exilis]|eukprot:MONOS_7685.1-p1 / transcript=MONOS_7685.1 / gene=MONOS_7685 / organism=Monocercomonoides_exilis_PA203 / gene_product=unspecified product / transcript_product=unspecified product / location=Mono_scaffold00269:25895-26101(-) / protein_length=69 / sequence_SO=supercontig / SO=protein_coding / is_pseudo=false